MSLLRKHLLGIFLLFLAVSFMCMDIYVCEAKDLNYYFGSDSTNYLSPDNKVIINVDDDGFATISTRLNAKAYYPTGVGDFIEIPIPYPPNRVMVEKINVSSLPQPAYKVIDAKNQTIIQIQVEESPREELVEILYTVKGIYDGSNLNIRLLPSSFTTEVSINIIINNKENWINGTSVELYPEPSPETYFLINEETLSFVTYLVLSNVNPRMIEFSLKTQTAPYSLEIIPYQAITRSILPTLLFFLITKMAKIISGRRRAGVIVLAYKTLSRRLGRFVLTIIGVGIPAMLIVQMLIQIKVAKNIFGLETPKIEWYYVLILIISILIGGFQVINTVFSSLLERMKELGVMRAIGFTPSYIFKLVIVESTIIGLLAGLLGSLLAVTSAIISTQIFYGLSIPNQTYITIMANSLGGISFNNSFLRSYMIAFIATITISMILGHLNRSESMTSDFFLIVPSVLYFLFLRPMDPFKFDRLAELAPTFVVNTLMGVLLATLLSISAGSYVAYLAGKIKPSEAMRHV